MSEMQASDNFRPGSPFAGRPVCLFPSCASECRGHNTRTATRQPPFSIVGGSYPGAGVIHYQDKERPMGPLIPFQRWNQDAPYEIPS